MTTTTATPPSVRCRACGDGDGELVALAGMGDGLIHRAHPACPLPAGREWTTDRDPAAPAKVKVPRGHVEATITRGQNILWALAYRTGAVFTSADWRRDADVQNVPAELMAIAVHRAIRRGWIAALDLNDGDLVLEQHDRRKTRFVSRIHRPRGRAR